MRLALAAFDEPGGNMIGDWAGNASGLETATGDHGFLSLAATLELPRAAAMAIYDIQTPAHIILSDGGIVAFEGRLEDKSLIGGGIQIGALGYWRALYDVPYTALWSDSRYNRWQLLNPDNHTVGSGRPALPDRWQADNNNRLYLAPTEGEDFGSSEASCIWVYAIPDRSERQIVAVDFDYDLTAASNWRAALTRRDGPRSGWTRLSDEWTLDGNGSTQSSTLNDTFTAADAIGIELFYNASTATFAGDTGDVYFSVTGLRVKTVTASTIGAEDIAGALVDHVNGVNSTQLQDSDLKIDAPGIDVDQAVYEDQYPGDILIALAAMGDDSTPPVAYEAGIWRDRRLYFRQAGSAARSWYIDFDHLMLQRSIDTLANSSYTLYAAGDYRTANDTDADSAARHGLTRRRVASADTESETTAQKSRDALIDTLADGLARAEIVARRVFDDRGAAWPLYAVRAGDTVTIRNLPPDLAALAEFRQFTLSGTRYQFSRAGGESLTIIPADLQTIETIISEG